MDQLFMIAVRIRDLQCAASEATACDILQFSHYIRRRDILMILSGLAEVSIDTHRVNSKISRLHRRGNRVGFFEPDSDYSIMIAIDLRLTTVRPTNGDDNKVAADPPHIANI